MRVIWKILVSRRKPTKADDSPVKNWIGVCGRENAEICNITWANPDNSWMSACRKDVLKFTYFQPMITKHTKRKTQFKKKLTTETQNPTYNIHLHGSDWTALRQKTSWWKPPGFLHLLNLLHDFHEKIGKGKLHPMQWCTLCFPPSHCQHYVCFSPIIYWVPQKNLYLLPCMTGFSPRCGCVVLQSKQTPQSKQSLNSKYFKGLAASPFLYCETQGQLSLHSESKDMHTSQDHGPLGGQHFPLIPLRCSIHPFLEQELGFLILVLWQHLSAFN